MCLAVPGKLIDVHDPSPEDAAGVGRTGIVDFQGSQIEVGLAFTPEARQGDWLLIHAGYALNILDEQEARETWDYLREAGVDVTIPDMLADEQDGPNPCQSTTQQVQEGSDNG